MELFSGFLSWLSMRPECSWTWEATTVNKRRSCRSSLFYPIQARPLVHALAATLITTAQFYIPKFKRQVSTSGYAGWANCAPVRMGNEILSTPDSYWWSLSLDENWNSSNKFQPPDSYWWSLWAWMRTEIRGAQCQPQIHIGAWMRADIQDKKSQQKTSHYHS